MSDSNNGPSPGLYNLGQMKDTPVFKSSTYGLLVGAISGQVPQA